jgi:hypothetical protein
LFDEIITAMREDQNVFTPYAKKIHTACERERGSGEIHGKGEGKAGSVSRRGS